jgi:16S rRNA (cytidine1402-2'-O)-methyltransferase
MLADAKDVLGPRPAAVCRELTKLHEEVVPGDLAVLAKRYDTEGPPRGEIVVVIGPPAASTRDAVSDTELDRQLRTAMAHDRLLDGVAAVAEATGIPRRRVYARALTLREKAK